MSGETDRTPGIHDRELFERTVHFRPAPDPGRVDEPDRPAILPIRPAPIERDSVAGDSGFRACQHALFADQAVEQRRFAGIGAPHDGERHRPVGDVRSGAVPRPRPAFPDTAPERAADRPCPARARRKWQAVRPVRGRKRRAGPIPASRPSHLLASSRTGVPARRSRLAKCRSSGVTPARASIRNSATAASSSARSACTAIRPSIALDAASSSPAVSTTEKCRSCRRADASLRSRVRPGGIVQPGRRDGRPAD